MSEVQEAYWVYSSKEVDHLGEEKTRYQQEELRVVVLDEGEKRNQTSDAVEGSSNEMVGEVMASYWVTQKDDTRVPGFSLPPC